MLHVLYNTQRQYTVYTHMIYDTDSVFSLILGIIYFSYYKSNISIQCAVRYVFKRAFSTHIYRKEQSRSGKKIIFILRLFKYKIFMLLRHDTDNFWSSIKKAGIRNVRTGTSQNSFCLFFKQGFLITSLIICLSKYRASLSFAFFIVVCLYVCFYYFSFNKTIRSFHEYVHPLPQTYMTLLPCNKDRPFVPSIFFRLYKFY